MNIEELNTQIEYLKETKNLIKQQLISKGQPVDDNTTFREYVDNMDILIDTEDGNIASNDLEIGKKAYSQGNEIVGTYNTDKDIGVLPLASFEISDDQSEIQKYYADGVEQGGMAALANLKCWQILFTEKALTNEGMPTRHSLEFLSWSPAIVQIDRLRSNSGREIYLFNQAHTQLFMQFDTALGMGITSNFISRFDITTSDLQAMSGWYENIEGVLTPIATNPSYSNIIFTSMFEVTLQDVIDDTVVGGKPVLNLDEINLNCTYTKFNDFNAEHDLVAYIARQYMDTANVEASDIIKNKTAYTHGRKITGTMQTQTTWYVTGAKHLGSSSDGESYGLNKLSYSSPIAMPVTNNGSIFVTIPRETLASSLNITADVVKTGTRISGVTGTYTSDATATANDITYPKTAYINGQKIVGNLASIAEDPITRGSQPTVTDDGSNIIVDRAFGDKIILNTNQRIRSVISYSDMANIISLTADKIKAGETILGITGTYAGSAMKEYASVTDMNNDISNIVTDEVVKVVESGTTSYFIKETISGTATMTKLVKESETMSPQEYTDANDIADEILGE